MAHFLKRYGRWLLVATATLMGTVLLLVSPVFPWSALNCWHDEVDIHSGKIRHTWMLLCCQVSQREEDSWLSREVGPRNHTPEWRRVCTYSPGWEISPHYSYHGAIHQIEMLQTIDEIIPLEPEARRRVANQVIDLWQKGTYFEAGAYLDKLAEGALELEKNGAAAVTEADLPPLDGD